MKKQERAVYRDVRISWTVVSLVKSFRSYLRGQPSPTACGLVGLLLFGAAGAIAGLVRGIDVHPATAWFAVFEIGVPAAAVGALLGFLVGFVAFGVAKIREHCHHE